jgi:hypothetical protein
MEFNWFNLFNKAQFLETGLPSRTLKFILEGIGEKEILVTVGNEVSILYEGVFLPVGFFDKNPFVREGFAVWEDENENIWLGVEV